MMTGYRRHWRDRLSAINAAGLQLLLQEVGGKGRLRYPVGDLDIHPDLGNVGFYDAYYFPRTGPTAGQLLGGPSTGNILEWINPLSITEIDRLTAQDGSHSQVILEEDPDNVAQLLYGTLGALKLRSAAGEIDLRPSSGVVRFSGATPAVDYWTAAQLAAGGLDIATYGAASRAISLRGGADHPVAVFDPDLLLYGLVSARSLGLPDDAGNLPIQFAVAPDVFGMGSFGVFQVQEAPGSFGASFRGVNAAGQNVFGLNIQSLFADISFSIGDSQSMGYALMPTLSFWDAVSPDGSYTNPRWTMAYDPVNKFMRQWGELYGSDPCPGVIPPGLILGSDVALPVNLLSSNDVLIAQALEVGGKTFFQDDSQWPDNIIAWFGLLKDAGLLSDGSTPGKLTLTTDGTPSLSPLLALLGYDAGGLPQEGWLGFDPDQCMAFSDGGVGLWLKNQQVLMLDYSGGTPWTDLPYIYCEDPNELRTTADVHNFIPITAAGDVVFCFDPVSGAGQIIWRNPLSSPGDLFEFPDDILLSTTERAYFRDLDISIWSANDGYLDLDADTKIRLRIGGTPKLVVQTASLIPNATGYDLGTAGYPFQDLMLSRKISIAESAAPAAAPANSAYIFLDAADDDLKVQFDSGSPVTIAVHP